MISALADCPHTSLIWQRSSVLTCFLFFLSCHKQAKRQPGSRRITFPLTAVRETYQQIMQILSIGASHESGSSKADIEDQLLSQPSFVPVGHHLNWSKRSTIIYMLNITIKGIHEIRYRNIAGRCLDYS